MMTRETSAGAIALHTKRAGSSIVRHDVDLLAAQLLHDRLDARALHADAGADRIDVAIARADTAIFERAPGSRADASMRTIFS